MEWKLKGNIVVTGKQVRLFLVDGSSSGLLTAEVMNWTGQIVAGARSELPALLERVETKRTGVYFLIGEGDVDPEEKTVYVGEGDDVSARLRHHNRSASDGGKDFWNRAMILTSKDANLTKAHIRYLESRFIEIGHAVDRAEIVNKTAPPRLPLPEADISDMEYFLNQARIVLPLLGLDAFRDVPRTESDVPVDAGNGPASPVFHMAIPIQGGIARAQEIDGEFVVFQGSEARAEWVGGDHNYRKLYDKLVKDGTLTRSGVSAQFTKPYAFRSPSAAAAVVAGRADNGRTGWKNPDTAMTYGQWQEQIVATALQDEE
ncbi:GIY-YIG nuclease family protein [Arthrobacter pigmenti]